MKVFLSSHIIHMFTISPNDNSLNFFLLLLPLHRWCHIKHLKICQTFQRKRFVVGIQITIEYEINLWITNLLLIISTLVNFLFISSFTLFTINGA